MNDNNIKLYDGKIITKQDIFFTAQEYIDNVLDNSDDIKKRCKIEEW